MQEGVLLEARDVSISYGAGIPDAVERVSFDIRRGETLALVGSNGSGKSTLIQGILELLPLKHGVIEKPNGLRVAYLAQMHGTSRDFPATVREIVLSGTQEAKAPLFYTRAQKQRAERAMELLQITQLKRARIGDLSGGQRQRALLARALAHEPELLIMDEPCSALDPEITASLYQLFDELAHQKQLALLIATHDWPYVKRSADRVLVLNKRVEYWGPVEGWEGMEADYTCHH